MVGRNGPVASAKTAHICRRDGPVASAKTAHICRRDEPVASVKTAYICRRNEPVASAKTAHIYRPVPLMRMEKEGDRLCCRLSRRFGGFGTRLLLAVALFEQDLSHADLRRSDFYQFIAFDGFESRLQ